jgi:predicted MFS family arabinose efflux permease
MFLTLVTIALLMSLLVFLLQETYKPIENKVQLKKIISEYQQLLTNPQAKRIFGLILILCICYGAILSFLAIYLSGFSAISNVGLFFTFFATGGLMGNVAGGMSVNRFSKVKSATICVGLFAIATALLYLVPFAPMQMLVICSLLGGFSFSASITIAVNWLIECVTEDIKGAALGLQENCIDGGFAIGSFIFGLLTLWATQQNIFLIMGISGFLLTVLMNRSSLRLSSKE